MNTVVVVVVVLGMVVGGHGLDNGLALTPPMGWLTWERFRCNTDCKNDPQNCISETLIKQMAERMAGDGYLAAGYDTIIIDDCWPDHQRDAQGRLQPDPDRFPSGIRNLSDYVHSLNLKFGIYEDYGTKTCGGYPGILGHLQTDATTFADWGVDYVKLDGCYADVHDMDAGYPEFGKYLNATGRPMVYSCSWPDYQLDHGLTPNWTSIQDSCNLWRFGPDVQDSWDSVSGILSYVKSMQESLAPLAGSGHWNDPDMLIIGNFGLSYEQSKAQMALWAVMSAPLIMSTDLRTITKPYRDILLNRAVIQVAQQPGKPFYTHLLNNNVQVWVKQMPMPSGATDVAAAILNPNTDGTPRMVVTKPEDLGVGPGKYDYTDLFSGKLYPAVLSNQTIIFHVNPTGVVLLRFSQAK